MENRADSPLITLILVQESGLCHSKGMRNEDPIQVMSLVHCYFYIKYPHMKAALAMLATFAATLLIVLGEGLFHQTLG